jgi:hypothetical protein
VLFAWGFGRTVVLVLPQPDSSSVLSVYFWLASFSPRRFSDHYWLSMISLVPALVPLFPGWTESRLCVAVAASALVLWFFLPDQASSATLTLRVESPICPVAA